MSNDQDAAAGLPAGGRGGLARVIATRGGLAAPEAPFVIEHREALIYMLCGPGRLARALRPVPVRPVAEQAVLQRHALVRRVRRPGPSARA